MWFRSIAGILPQMCPGCCSELPESNTQQLPMGQRALVTLLNQERVCEATRASAMIRRKAEPASTKSITHDQKKSRACRHKEHQP